ncbi:hypothetical protein BMW24_008710 [Mycobacterium heckeshornense]|nr:hypothetical protein ACT16_22965 [Mycobacterium heckeshornense]PIJ35834.1 hypothetical protein BMW24_008710 [Mycobacterium heckeshornense]
MNSGGGTPQQNAGEAAKPLAETEISAGSANAFDALVGIVSRIDKGPVEHLQERRDRDRTAWIGSPTFKRPPSHAERTFISPLCDERGSDGHWTLVDLSGGVWCRSWPSVAYQTRRDSFNPRGQR